MEKQDNNIENTENIGNIENENITEVGRGIAGDAVPTATPTPYDASAGNEETQMEETQMTDDGDYYSDSDFDLDSFPEEEEQPEKRRVADELLEWAEIATGALAIVILLFTFVFRMVTVDGPSMQQTLQSNDSLIISHLFYTPKQGDIVVIQVPNPSFPVPIIKRVIATEGQEVYIDFDTWRVYVDGTALEEPYVNYIAGQTMRRDSILPGSMPITVEPGKIFVLGDNRNHSSDSRNALIGQVDVYNVVGRAIFRLFPFSQFGAVRAG